MEGSSLHSPCSLGASDFERDPFGSISNLTHMSTMQGTAPEPQLKPCFRSSASKFEGPRKYIWPMALNVPVGTLAGCRPWLVRRAGFIDLF